MGKKSAKKEDPDYRAGGWFFLFSIVSIAVIDAFLLATIRLFVTAQMLSQLLAFGGALLFGILLGAALLQGKSSVLIHEFKHSLISGLAGNRWKEMKVGKRSGHFMYEYTEDTEHLNGFISLAPYWVPLFTMAGVVIAAVTTPPPSLGATLLIATLLGIDCACNVRDISPHQTDFSMLRGGYYLGLIAVTVFNLFTITAAVLWAVGGMQSLAWITEVLLHTVSLLADELLSL